MDWNDSTQEQKDRKSYVKRKRRAFDSLHLYIKKAILLTSPFEEVVKGNLIVFNVKKVSSAERKKLYKKAYRKTEKGRLQTRKNKVKRYKFLMENDPYYRVTLNFKRRIISKKHRDNLGTSYVNNLLHKFIKSQPRTIVPVELIELKRTQLQLRRAVFKLDKAG